MTRSTLDSVDFFHDPELVADPYAFLRRMRDTSPVLREPGHGVLVVTGYDEALAVLGDHDAFSSCTTVVPTEFIEAVAEAAASCPERAIHVKGEPCQ